MKFIPHILYEDNHLLILEKPAGLLSQGDHTGDPNLVDLVKEYLKVKYQKPGNVYVGLVHRLDRPVSGIIILTKTSKASSRLQEQMKAGEIEKYYLAVTESHPPKEDDTLTHYLTKDEGKNKTKVYDHAKSDTKICSLYYRVLANMDGQCLLEVELQTGRSHQIRAQLAHIGCPIKGDTKYGRPATKNENDMALYAYRIVLTHPVSKEVLSIVSFPQNTGYWRNLKGFFPK
ncbi:MAG: RNA pseudouridine synthase [Saprospiraceae bacterium]|nr:RNA pseudouridine synthase [Saprospiraceae bacterium]MBK8449588.1 RNA pseudouridine synthase [Saprospiraceae bacterium]MBK8484346.1 RNA pseudouridine synthase [Saprospiraceae bacterium]MBK9221734.1 RNA pseudouridine synthase [Saprospiraceae bacterium]MBK9721329.1 RNA pseudouridine synthase [Saprospiraceae bacterium]